MQQPLLVSGRRFGTSPLTLKGDSKTYFYNSVSKRRIFILARIVNVIELSFFLNLGFLDFFFFCNFLFPLRDRQTLIRVFIYHLEVSRQISCLLNGSTKHQAYIIINSTPFWAPNHLYISHSSYSDE